MIWLTIMGIVMSVFLAHAYGNSLINFKPNWLIKAEKEAAEKEHKEWLKEWEKRNAEEEEERIIREDRLFARTLSIDLGEIDLAKLRQLHRMYKGCPEEAKIYLIRKDRILEERTSRNEKRDLE